jgi:hypothetical protein
MYMREAVASGSKGKAKRRSRPNSQRSEDHAGPPVPPVLEKRNTKTPMVAVRKIRLPIAIFRFGSGDGSTDLSNFCTTFRPPFLLREDGAEATIVTR